ncbi:MAG: hypothetical protein V3S24_07820 [Candidatus Tectomicrobia bacterium]
MEKDIESPDQGEVFGRSWAWFWLILPPLVMFVVPTGIIQFMITPGWSPHDFAASFAEGSDVLAGHISHRMVYAAMAYFHVAVCLCATLFFWDQLRGFPQFLRHRAYAFMISEAVFFLGIWLFWRGPEVALYRLSYLNIKELLLRTEAGADITTGLVTKLSMFATVPQGFGVVAVIVAVGVAGSVAGNLSEARESEWRQRFAVRVHTLQRCFLGLSAVLVTSTLTMMLFFQFPAELAADSNTKMVLSHYARGLTVFWGMVYTLTLIATFAPAAVFLRNTLRRQQQGVGSPEEFREWVAQKVLVSPQRVLGNLAALLAPVLAGLLGTLLKSLAGGG